MTILEAIREVLEVILECRKRNTQKDEPLKFKYKSTSPKERPLRLS